MTEHSSHPRLGIQGPVVAWQDPWAKEESDAIMRTGTGVRLDSQDPTPTAEGYLALLRDLGADFHVHHVIPGLHGQAQMLHDSAAAGLGVVLGNEYGNINGPYVLETNRWDVPAALVADAAATGGLIGVLYDEPEHLQINADQYRNDAFHPHFAKADGLAADEAADRIAESVAGIVRETDAATAGSGIRVPVLAEQVFPVLFHTLARGGMTPTPKIMKESFQPLQLSTALGAALQYGRDFWVCADLWGPDTGPWFTRAPGFPGHSPAEYASALRMGYLFAPSHLFTENIDVLIQHLGDDRFERSEFGEVWDEFVRDFVPRTPLGWSFADARPDIVLIHAEDSDFGRGTLPFGVRGVRAPEEAQSIFAAWHLLSHGSIPPDGSCMHIDRYRFPRHTLNGIPRSTFPLREGSETATRTHPLFHPVRNTLVFDETVTSDRLGDPELIVVAGTRLPDRTRDLLRRRAESGAVVVIPRWLAGPHQAREHTGSGSWVVYDDLLNDDDAKHAISLHLGSPDRWTQRFGDTEIIFEPADAEGVTLHAKVGSQRGARV